MLYTYSFLLAMLHHTTFLNLDAFHKGIGQFCPKRRSVPDFLGSLGSSLPFSGDTGDTPLRSTASHLGKPRV